MTAIADLPDIRPSLLLDFANSGRVDPRIECTRASAATCFGPDGKLRVVPANTPRIDYDPATGKCLGLLVEESRTNLAPYSESFVSGWGRQTLNIDSVEQGGIYTHRLYASSFTGDPISFSLPNKTVATGPLTLSIFVSSENNARYVQLTVGSSIAAGRVNFDLVDGVITANDSGNGAAIQKIATGYRISATFNVSESSNAIIFALMLIQSATSGRWPSWVPTAPVSLLMGRPQVEQGSFPTSYIPTEGVSVTRAAERVSISTQGWFTPDSFSSFVSFTRLTTANAASGGGTSVPRIIALGGSSSSPIQVRLSSATSAEAVSPSGYTIVSWAAGSPVAFGFGRDMDRAVLVNQATGLNTDTTVSPIDAATVNTLVLGSAMSGAGHIGQGWFHAFRSYQRLLSNNQLSRLAKL